MASLPRTVSPTHERRALAAPVKLAMLCAAAAFALLLFLSSH
jgi:hypothetical protein